MKPNKIKMISDSVHGVIHISKLEKMLISTQSFNRLHNIKQSSTVYMTYPSNQTTRFTHSLGTMHLAGKMFFYSIVNADHSTRKKFLEKINKIISSILQNADFIKWINRSLGKYAKIINEYEKIVIYDSLYQSYTPNLPQHIFAYQVTFQAVRCAALLHDLGHPPFSHVTEYALERVLKEIKQKADDTLNKREIEFLDSYDIGGEIHEMIGRKIGTRMISEAISADRPSTETDAQRVLFFEIVSWFTDRIFDGEKSIFESIHNLIDGAIDCDRLDYVTRDSKNSAFSGTDRINFDRFIPAMRLIEYGSAFCFAGSIATLSTVEELFNQRWQLYSYVNYHHRVVKTNQLLEDVIVKLSIKYLMSSDEGGEDIGQVLPLNISGLWKAIKQVSVNQEFFDWIIQWDDAWLLSILRREYFSNYQDSKVDEDIIIRDQLYELLSNRKNYVSCIKRREDFLKVDTAIVENFVCDWDQLIELGKKSERITSYIEMLRTHQEAWKTNPEGYAFSDYGFFLTRIRQLFNIGFRIGDFEQVIEQAIQQQVIIEKMEHYMVAFETIKTGLERQAILSDADGQGIDVRTVSRIGNDLRNAAQMFPVFFLYIKAESELNNKEKFLQDIGKSIAERLPDAIADIIESLVKKTKE